MATRHNLLIGFNGCVIQLLRDIYDWFHNDHCVFLVSPPQFVFQLFSVSSTRGMSKNVSHLYDFRRIWIKNEQHLEDSPGSFAPWKQYTYCPRSSGNGISYGPTNPGSTI